MVCSVFKLSRTRPSAEVGLRGFSIYSSPERSMFSASQLLAEYRTALNTADSRLLKDKPVLSSSRVQISLLKLPPPSARTIKVGKRPELPKVRGRRLARRRFAHRRVRVGRASLAENEHKRVPAHP